MATDPIEHVVVLMLENHSFDQMLGGLASEIGFDGVDPSAPRSNLDKDNRPYFQAPTTAASISPDPKHEKDNVLRQLDKNNGGFVLDYSLAYPDTTPDQRQQIMNYYAPGALPVLHELARRFAVCDRWFSSVPGPTWTNRFFVHSGTSLGRVTMPGGLFNGPLLFLGYDQDTLYDRLNDRGLDWRIYFSDVPHSLVLSHQRRPENALRHRPMAEFYADAADTSHPFPAYSFIEPRYYWPNQNDDHPPHPTARAEQLIADVYNTLRQNETLWRSTLLVVLYDEHGGFFDHVAPPAAVPPDQHSEEYTFDRLGVRVPAVLVSPWIDPAVVHTVFEHTSLLRYLSDKWNLAPLTARVASANSFAGVIHSDGSPRDDTPVALSLPEDQRELAVVGTADVSDLAVPINEHQRSLLNFSEYLEKEILEPAVLKEARRLAIQSGSVLAQIEAARNRVQVLLAQRRAQTD
jgi:phospholipase C